MKFRDKLTFKFAVTILAVGILTTGSAALVNYFGQLKRHRSETEDRIDQILSTIKITAAQAAYELDQDLSETIVSGLTGNTLFRRAVLIDNFGTTLAEEGPESPQLDSVSRMAEKYFVFPDRKILLFVKIDSFVGTLDVSIDSETIYRQFVRLHGNFLLYYILWDLFSIFIFTIVFYLFLIRPILKLNNALLFIMERDFTVEHYYLPTSFRKDEVGELTKTTEHLIQLFQDNIKAYINAQNDLRSSLREKEVLLKEIHHRVKNNLQIISSLLRLQSEEREDPEIHELFQECQNRVSAMSLVHAKLYETENLSSIQARDYIEEILGSLAAIYCMKSHTEYSITCGDITLEISVAIVFGLILNELVSNAYKYGGCSDGDSTVSVTFVRENDNFTLTVHDNGPGLSDETLADSPGTLGLQLVRTLTLQLRGLMEYSYSGGALFRITFPVRQNENHY